MEENTKGSCCRDDTEFSKGMSKMMEQSFKHMMDFCLSKDQQTPLNIPHTMPLSMTQCKNMMDKYCAGLQNTPQHTKNGETNDKSNN
ncbi:MAG: hypothetical protein ABUK01_07100 [Leptospirales bacterium]